jgi:hypothetical protein
VSAAGGRRLVVAAIALSGVAVALRFWNAGAYPAGWGYDEIQNWRYVALLLDSWALPAPDADWSTAHPPLYHYAAAALVRTLGRPEPSAAMLPIRLAGAAAGLAAAWLTARLVHRLDPARPQRALLAAALVLFLPAHVVMSAMMNEEILASALTSLAIATAAQDLAAPRGASKRRAAWSGVAAGLAWLTKLSGAVAVAAVAGAYALDGLRRRHAGAGLSRAALVLALALVAGGWYYARNLVSYGYLYPHDLEVHAMMHTMPPGERQVLDYLRVPLATFTDPQALHPDLLRSVWGTTFAGFFFDAHRHFLPRESDAVSRTGTLLLLLALLPTAAFAVGLARGVRRALAGVSGADLPLLLLVVGTLSGYVLFTWRNPWFAAVKGSYLLGLAVPYGYYASDILADWTAGRGPRALLVRAWLVAFALGVLASFTFGVWSFDHLEYPGMRWMPPERP